MMSSLECADEKLQAVSLSEGRTPPLSAALQGPSAGFEGLRTTCGIERILYISLARLSKVGFKFYDYNDKISKTL